MPAFWCSCINWIKLLLVHGLGPTDIWACSNRKTSLNAGDISAAVGRAVEGANDVNNLDGKELQNNKFKFQNLPETAFLKKAKQFLEPNT